MSFFKNLFSKEKKYSTSERELIDMNVCPGCWGWQEYQDVFHEDAEKLKDDRAFRKSFIQKFVESNINGVKMKPVGKKIICPSCKKDYKIIR